MRPKTNVKYYRDPALPGIDICRVTKSRHCFPVHFHDDQYIISLITSGACRCLNKGRGDLVADRGGITLINPGQIHSGTPLNNTPLDYTNCYFSLSAMNGLAEILDPGADNTLEFTASVLKDPMVTALLGNLFRTLITSRDTLEKEALVIAAFHFLFSKYGRFSPVSNDSAMRHQPVVKAKEILSGQLDRKITLAEVSRSVGLSQYHFLRTFKRETGLPPHMFRTLKRLERAKQFLHQKMPPARVALETGFTDQSHFSNTFRRYVGATPKQYLAQN